MKKRLIAVLLILALLAVGCSNTGGGSSSEEGGEEVITHIFQSKATQFEGFELDGAIMIPFEAFVEDMGYELTINGKSVTIKNTDMDVEHTMEIGSNVVKTGDEKYKLLSALDNHDFGAGTLLYISTDLYAVFDGEYSN